MVDRIRQLLQDKQLTPTQFADAIGIARPIVSHILSGRNKPSLEVVQKILAAFADLSMPWLLNGSGPMWTAIAHVASVPPMVPGPGVAAESSAQPSAAAKNAAETSHTNVATDSEEENNSSKARRQPQPSEQPIGAAVPSASGSKRPVASALPMPRRFQAAGPGLAKVVEAEKATDVPQSLPEAASAPELVTAAAPPLSAPTPPTLAEASNIPAASVATEAAAFLLQPGKAIRRIVIFYQDGSFADYQPE